MASGSEVRSILLIDDEEDVHLHYAKALRPRSVCATSQVKVALELARRQAFELVLVDLHLGPQQESPDTNTKPRFRSTVGAWGIDVVRLLRQQNPSTTILVITGGFSLAYAKAARAAGADEMMRKMVGPEKIVAIVEAGMLEPERPELPMSLARNEFEYMAQVFVDNDQNMSRTSSDLGIARSSLQRKLRRPAPRR